MCYVYYEILKTYVHCIGMSLAILSKAKVKDKRFHVCEARCKPFVITLHN